MAEIANKKQTHPYIIKTSYTLDWVIFSGNRLVFFNIFIWNLLNSQATYCYCVIQVADSLSLEVILGFLSLHHAIDM